MSPSEALTAGCGCHGCRVEIPRLLARLDATEEALREAEMALGNDPVIFGFHQEHPERRAEDCILCVVQAALEEPT